MRHETAIVFINVMFTCIICVLILIFSHLPIPGSFFLAEFYSVPVMLISVSVVVFSQTK